MKQTLPTASILIAPNSQLRRSCRPQPLARPKPEDKAAAKRLIGTGNRQGQRSPPTNIQPPNTRRIPQLLSAWGAAPAAVAWAAEVTPHGQAGHSPVPGQPAGQVHGVPLLPTPPLLCYFLQLTPRQFPSRQQLPHTQPGHRSAPCSGPLAPNAVHDFSLEISQLCGQ